MEQQRIIKGKYFREHPFCIKAGTLVELIDRTGTGRRLYFDGYDAYGARRIYDYLGLFPVFKYLAKDGSINRNRNHFIDPHNFTTGRYDIKVIREPGD